MLLPQHQKLIDESGISPEVAAARGYRSVETQAELKRLGFAATQCRVPALLIPIYDVTGSIATYQIRPDAPRVDGKRGKAIKYETIARAKMAIDVPPGARLHIGDPAVPLFITEGIRKADSAVSLDLCCLGLLGVWNWRGTNDAGGKTALPDWESIALDGRRVYLAFDSDYVEKPQVRKALLRLKEFCKLRGATVLTVSLPPGPGGQKVGLDDYISAGHTVQDLLALANEELSEAQRDSDAEIEQGRYGRTMLVLREGDLHALSLETWEALTRANALPSGPTLFRHGDTLARIERTDDGELRVGILRQDTMRRELVRLVEFQKLEKGSGETLPARPPGDLVGNLLAWPDPPLPLLARLAYVPIFERTGRLVTQEGYDQGSGIYLSLRGLDLPPVPERPSDQDVERARGLLLNELIGDFPFARQADRANAVAVLLLPFVRELIDGPTPLHVIEKPTPGTGATLLTEALSIPSIGRSPSIMTEGRDEDEWRKRITAVLSHSPTIVVIDNLRNTLDSAAASAVLTATTWEDRLLGHSRMVMLPVRCVWVATGNNPNLSHEVARRAVPIRMDAQMDHPWERSRDTFRHPELRRWAIENRGQLVWAALVLVKTWLQSGRPGGSQPNLGSYEGYASVLGGILERGGISGFLTNLADFYSRADREAETWRGLIQAWWNRFGLQEVATTEVWGLIQGMDFDIELGKGTERGLKTKLGILLRHMRDRRFTIQQDDEPLEVVLKHARDCQGTARYQLRLTEARGPQGPGGPLVPTRRSPDEPMVPEELSAESVPDLIPAVTTTPPTTSSTGVEGPRSPPGPRCHGGTNGSREVFEL